MLDISLPDARRWRRIDPQIGGIYRSRKGSKSIERKRFIIYRAALRPALGPIVPRRGSALP